MRKDLERALDPCHGAPWLFVIPFRELLNYHAVRGKTASPNASEMTISSWVGPEYPLCRAFSATIGEEHGNFG
jgi:hypothetical protein